MDFSRVRLRSVQLGAAEVLRAAAGAGDGRAVARGPGDDHRNAKPRNTRHFVTVLKAGDDLKAGETWLETVF